jgi:hypothetical protein
MSPLYPIGKIERVNMRSIWKREDADFTKWLAENIDYLNEIIDLDISIESIEEKVGPYRVDLFGESGDGRKLIIENQLEKTDHTHLGQLITYLVNLDVKIGIWISTNPTDEHQAVIEWLNEITPDDLSFYLIKIEGIKIKGQESVAPLFTVIEGPTEERKKIGAEKKEFARSHTVRRKFWAQFLDKINKQSPLCQNISPSNDNWIGIGLGKSGIGLNLVISRTYARVEIYINRGSAEENKAWFDKLAASKDEIEKALGTPLIWERMDNKVTSRIKYQRDGLNVFNEEEWPQMISFLIDGIMRMHKIFKEPVQKL